ncbi:NmrA family NAD(P)-binding protein [Pseudonocardia lacus]|uniref:NmrA family NAD(P)-binding protein n=1 Tax=Pseudonocardia lacus TaxID=2835865 RepID=UPI001BDCA487|nr:NmrA family NAD(P)-binding protein [Pseudonocardia lacus]
MTILVTGATGNIGRMVVDHLLDAGAPVRALTVDPARAALPDGVEVARGNLRRPETLPAALAGVERLYLAPTPDTVVDVLTLAREAGVSYVVDLSGEPESWWGSVTTAVEDSGIAWTHLWPGDFMENSLSWAPGIAAARTVREPYPEGRSAPTAMDDIARVAAACLLTDAHVGRALSITGPEVLTRVELAERIGEALGEPVVFETVTRDVAVAEMTEVMGPEAEWYVDTILAGAVDNPVQVSTAIEDVTGKPATTFAQWARDNAAVFRG